MAALSHREPDRVPVQAEVKRRVEELGRGGGYVLCASRNIQPDVSAEKILAMYRHVREYVPRYAR